MESLVYNYKILNEVYNDIIVGRKTIEFRLLNEKSERINNGDYIVFKVLDDESKSIKVKVMDKKIYNDLDELLKDKESLNGNILNLDNEGIKETFYSIYGKDVVLNSKIVGIRFKKI